ncbi:MAG: sugar ABC transporter permease [Anaerolineae bacterium]|nr:sugar ABC transporter permease [Anaerolineae bacterium]
MIASTTRRYRISPTLRRDLLGLLFISPWLIGFLIWTLYPLGASLYYSFHRYDLMRPPSFIGFKNYVDLFTKDPRMGTVAFNTLFYVGLSAPLGVISAFLMATLLNTRIKGRSFFRAIFFFPSIVPVVVSAIVWRFLLDPQWGAVNATLRGLGFTTMPFLSNPDWAKPTLIMIHIWAQGSAIVTFLASLQDVPRSLYEAATVDGANNWQKFWHVTIPMCSPVILFNLIMAFIGGFQVFGLPYILTNGGPNMATEMYSMHLYRNAFTHLRMGKASAMAWVLFIVIVTFTVILFKSSARWVYYGSENDNG